MFEVVFADIVVAVFVVEYDLLGKKEVDESTVCWLTNAFMQLVLQLVCKNQTV